MANKTLIYQEKIPAAIRDKFVETVITYSKALEIDPNWLMLVMNSESGVNPQARNKDTNATGLIQFMPSTATGLGTTVDKLYNMNAVTQMMYVYNYFKPHASKIKCFNDLYMITFYPIALGKAGNYVLGAERGIADKVAKQNPAISKYAGASGLIDVDTFKRYTDSKIPSDIRTEVQKTESYFRFLKTGSAAKYIIFGAIPIILGIVLIYHSAIERKIFIDVK